MGRARLLAALTLMAFCVRALVPTGFMPVPAGEGRPLTVAMCSAGVMQLHTPPGPGAPTIPTKKHQAPCVYAVAATFASSPDSECSIPLEPRSIDAGPPSLVTPPARFEARAHRPRAPPIHA